MVVVVVVCVCVYSGGGDWKNKTKNYITEPDFFLKINKRGRRHALTLRRIYRINFCCTYVIILEKFDNLARNLINFWQFVEVRTKNYEFCSPLNGKLYVCFIRNSFIRNLLLTFMCDITIYSFVLLLI